MDNSGYWWMVHSIGQQLLRLDDNQDKQYIGILDFALIIVFIVIVNQIKRLNDKTIEVVLLCLFIFERHCPFSGR